MKKGKTVEMRNCSIPELEKYHKTAFQLVYVECGTLEYQVANRQRTAGKGSCFFLDTTERFPVKTVYCSKDLRVIQLLFLPEFIDKYLAGVKNMEAVFRHYLIDFHSPRLSGDDIFNPFLDENGKILQLLNSLQEETNRREPGYLNITRCMVIEILIHALRMIPDHHNNWNGETEVEFMQNFINENYMNKITLGMLSEQLYLGVPTLSAKFKREMGMTFSNYLRRIRIEHSCRLLANTNKKIVEVAMLSGFTGIRHFYVVFKKWMGMSPSAYRLGV